jgi:hypothetical protein
MAANPKKRTSRRLLLEFFLNFSRFEYALKASGYFKRANPSRQNRPDPPDANPDWCRFRMEMRTIFRIDRNEELLEACQYILDDPPRKQVIVNDSAAWETPVRSQHESEIEFLLRMVKCVRNNLFHGGKHNIELHEDTQRTELLLRSGLVILRECLRLAPHVKQEFDQAVI